MEQKNSVTKKNALSQAPILINFCYILFLYDNLFYIIFFQNANSTFDNITILAIVIMKMCWKVLSLNYFWIPSCLGQEIFIIVCHKKSLTIMDRENTNHFLGLKWFLSTSRSMRRLGTIRVRRKWDSSQCTYFDFNIYENIS